MGMEKGARASRQTATIRGDRTEWQHLNREVTTSVKADQKPFIEIRRGDSKWFSIGRGVRQWCILSPHLFIIYAEALEDFEGGIKIGGRRITNWRYADDTTLLCGRQRGSVVIAEER